MMPNSLKVIGFVQRLNFPEDKYICKLWRVPNERVPSTRGPEKRFLSGGRPAGGHR